MEAEMINGVCIILRTVALQDVGLFDDRLFMYVEDADLGIRLHRNGWRLAYVPIDSVEHLQKNTGYDLYSWPSLLLRRNCVYFLKKHGRPVQAWGLAGANVLLFLTRICASRSTSDRQLRASFFRAMLRELYGVLVTNSWEGPGSWRPEALRKSPSDPNQLNEEGQPRKPG